MLCQARHKMAIRWPEFSLEYRSETNSQRHWISRLDAVRQRTRAATHMGLSPQKRRNTGQCMVRTDIRQILGDVRGMEGFYSGWSHRLHGTHFKASNQEDLAMGHRSHVLFTTGTHVRNIHRLSHALPLTFPCSFQNDAPERHSRTLGSRDM